MASVNILVPESCDIKIQANPSWSSRYEAYPESKDTKKLGVTYMEIGVGDAVLLSSGKNGHTIQRSPSSDTIVKFAPKLVFVENEGVRCSNSSTIMIDYEKCTVCV